MRILTITNKEDITLKYQLNKSKLDLLGLTGYVQYTVWSLDDIKQSDYALEVCGEAITAFLTSTVSSFSTMEEAIDFLCEVNLRAKIEKVE